MLLFADLPMDIVQNSLSDLHLFTRDAMILQLLVRQIGENIGSSLCHTYGVALIEPVIRLHLVDCDPRLRVLVQHS